MGGNNGVNGRAGDLRRDLRSQGETNWPQADGTRVSGVLAKGCARLKEDAQPEHYRKCQRLLRRHSHRHNVWQGYKSKKGNYYLGLVSCPTPAGCYISPSYIFSLV